jgi:hypothetical protein
VKKKSKITIIVAVIVIVFLANGIRMFYENKIYGYKDLLQIEYAKGFTLFNDSISSKINIELAGRDGLNDSIYFLTYGNEYLIIIWNLNQYQNLPLSAFVESKDSQSKMQHVKSYLTIAYPKHPKISIFQKEKLPISDTIFYYISGAQSAYQKIEKNYILHTGNYKAIKLFTNKKYIDLSLSRYESSISNFAIVKSQASVSMIFMISLTGKDLIPNDFVNLLNPNFKLDQ